MSDQSWKMDNASAPWEKYRDSRGPSIGFYVLLALVTALLIWSYRGSEIRLGQLFSQDGAGQIYVYIKALFPPDLSQKVLVDAALGAMETFAISFVGILMAAVIALLLVFFASRNLVYSGLLYEMEGNGRWMRFARIIPYLCAKGILNFLRTVPEMIWALIFVFLVGLGPFPGVLALGVHTGGVLGKLFAEVLEDVDNQPIESLQSMGASKMQILIYGVLPQVAPQFISYILYRWGVNIRVAAVLGFVGAGFTSLLASSMVTTC